ncbi:hypothetical protein BMS3Abin15_00643 [bacterium BMS3Abin15]|nr:hypothetical protein BMS3Abin15_00643 [bacterium BMS3Abin15]
MEKQWRKQFFLKACLGANLKINKKRDFSYEKSLLTCVYAMAPIFLDSHISDMPKKR